MSGDLMRGPIPPEPPLGTWVIDRFGATAQRRIDVDGRDGWGEPGFYSGGKWADFYAARGPLVECSPWGVEEKKAHAKADAEAEVARRRIDVETAQRNLDRAQHWLAVAEEKAG